MTVIIRLQNLPWTANALDIRRYFHGLAIPDGGVHIVGGDKGDAFIAFGTDEDARKAMMMDSGLIGNSTVKLMLSSKAEMQNVIAVARGTPAGGPAMGGEHYGLHQGGPGSMPSQGGGGGPQNQGGFRDGGRGMGGAGGPGLQHSSQQDRFGPRSGDSRDMRGHGSGGQGFQSGSTNYRGGPLGGPPALSSRIPSLSRGGALGSGMPDHGMGSSGRGGPDDLMGGPGRGGHDDRMGGPGRGGRDERMGGPGRGGHDDHMGGPGRGGHDDRMGGPARGGHEDRMGGPALDRRMGGMNMGPDPDQRMRGMPMSMGGHDLSDDRIGGPAGLDRGLMGGASLPLIGLEQRINQRMINSLERGGGSLRGGDSLLDMRRGADLMGGSGSGVMPLREEPVGGHMDGRDLFHGDGPTRLGLDNFNRDGGMAGGDGPSRGDMMHSGFSRDGGNMHGGLVSGGRMSVGGDMLMGSGINFNRDGPMMSGARDDNIGPGFNRMSMDGMGGRDGSPFRDGALMGPGMGGSMAFDRPIFTVHNDGSGGRHSPLHRGPDRDRDRDLRDSAGGRKTRRHAPGDIYVFASNFPTSVTYKDVRSFFRGCEIPRDGLKLINDRNGQRSGAVYVKFAWEQGAFDATKRNGRTVDGKPINIERVSEEEYLRATDSFVPPGVNIRNRRDDSPPSSRKRSRSPIQRRRDNEAGSADTKFLVIKNAPYNAEKGDVKKFLSSARCAVETIVLGRLEDGRASGSIFVELESRKGSQTALKLSKETMMGRSVSVLAISQREFEERTKIERSKRSGSAKLGSGGRAKEREEDEKSGKVMEDGEKSDEKRGRRNLRNMDPEKKYYCVKMSGLPYQASNLDVRKFFDGLEISYRGVHMVYSSNGTTHNVGFVEFVTSTDCKKALDKNKQYMGKRYIEVEAITKKDMLAEFAELQNRYGARGGSGAPRSSPRGLPAGSSSRGGGGGGGSSGGSRGSGSGSGSSSSQQQDCVVRLTNLSTEAQIDDVLNFFRPFHPLPDSVRFHYNSMNQHTGEGMLAFGSLQDAQRAIRELNLKKLMGRPLCLHLD